MKTIFKTLTITLAVLAFFAVGTGQAQPGCTDPQANNYDPQATENDGSCSYNTTNYAPLQIANLPSNLSESSGLAFFDDRLWTHLDGGNIDQLFQVDTLTGAVLETVTIPNSDNKDWEDLAEDDEHIYIGDFGNNFGNRMDLRIYKIKKNNLIGGTPSPELIEFSFSDQTDFTTAQNAHNYDCEAFFYWQDSLHLFSKNWLDFKTRHYVLPTMPGTYIAELRDSFNTQGQVTAADISDDGTVLLLGYNIASQGDPFMWLLFDYQGNNFFSGNKRRIALGNVLFTSQVEGLTFRDATRGFISSENLSVLPGKLMAFDIEAYLDNPVPTEATVFDRQNISIFPNPATDVLTVFFENINAQEIQISITDLSGKIILEKVLDYPNLETSFSLDVSDLPNGSYWLVAKANTNIMKPLLFQKQ